MAATTGVRRLPRKTRSAVAWLKWAAVTGDIEACAAASAGASFMPSPYRKHMADLAVAEGHDRSLRVIAQDSVSQSIRATERRPTEPDLNLADMAPHALTCDFLDPG